LAVNLAIARPFICRAGSHAGRPSAGAATRRTSVAGRARGRTDAPERVA